MSEFCPFTHIHDGERLKAVYGGGAGAATAVVLHQLGLEVRAARCA
ncbi:hypothetical protein [Streptomyces sp. PSKA30]|nr:hypothetical protein [Streptomyces sp. PSKA30]MBZ9638033.1 hypothetical protein [Streptomyces sp. PSKA30]